VRAIASHNLNRLLDKPGDSRLQAITIRKYLLDFVGFGGNSKAAAGMNKLNVFFDNAFSGL
jgi:hypothetical protein